MFPSPLIPPPGPSDKNFWPYNKLTRQVVFIFYFLNHFTANSSTSRIHALIEFHLKICIFFICCIILVICVAFVRLFLFMVSFPLETLTPRDLIFQFSSNYVTIILIFFNYMFYRFMMCEKVEEEPQRGDIFNLKEIKESLKIAETLARAAMATSPAAKRRLAARKLEMGFDCDSEFVPSKQVLLYLVRMGSFTSSPKIENLDSADDDLSTSFHQTTQPELLSRCQKEIESAGRPPLLSRSFRYFGKKSHNSQPFVRVLQWNVLSQSLGVSNDNFVKIPPESLDWTSRKFLILQEIIQHDPDIICLEEVDHFKFLEYSLGSIGFTGKFFPKPDSPCMYLEGNNGPDGAALFFRSSKFELIRCETRILEVWHVQSNQVGLLCVLREKATGKEICVAVTHLKAKTGALLSTLRDHQGRDLLNWLDNIADGRPIILCGDFNAEPSEPVYKKIISHSLQLKSAYCIDGKEPPFTTWKVREEGEICHTIDYIFYSSSFKPVAVLDFPDESTIGPTRVPSLKYPSDHFSLVVDFILNDE